MQERKQKIPGSNKILQTGFDYCKSEYLVKE